MVTARAPNFGPVGARIRRWPWAALALLTWGVALSFVPLLNLLAFEFAFFTTSPVTLIAGWRGARVPPADGPRATLLALARTLGLTLLPLVPITLNALRVRNCNFPEGLAFYALLPVLTAVIAFMWGRAASLLAPRRAFRVFLGVVAASVAQAVHHFWTCPPVDAFHPFVGYFPGSLYDEVIPLTRRLMGSRGLDLVWAAGAWALALAWRSSARSRSRLILASLGGLALAGAWLAAEPLDLHRDPEHVQAALGGLAVTPHFRMHHPASLSATAVASLETELEFRHAELTTFFGKAPAGPIDVWFYASTAQKKRLMGAGQVRIAKPWQRAVHLQTPDIGDGILAHELAHAFSAEISAAPHHLSLTAWFLPNMGLIEGVAVAAAWDDTPLDAHQWSLAMRTLGVATPLASLLSPQGFMTTNSRAAYTQCGSFVRWLRDSEGAEAVERLYRTGRVPEATEGGEAREGAIARWEGWLAHRAVDEDALAIARVRFDRPAIFGKVCAHEIAALRAQVDARSQSEPAAALGLVDEMLGHMPCDPETQLLRVSLLYRLGDAASLKAAETLATTLAETPTLGRVRQARAREWQADILAREGRPEDEPRVRALYAALLSSSFDRGWTRRIAVKHAAVGAGPWGQHVLSILTLPEADDAEANDTRLREAAAADPLNPLTHYLLGRMSARHGDHREAIRTTLAAVAAGLPHVALTFEALRLVAAVRFDAREYAAAADDFDRLSRRTDLGLQSGEVEGLRVWSRRARFFAEHPPAPEAQAAEAAN